MYEIIEIPVGTIPDKDSKIYPEYLEDEYIKVCGVFNISDGAEYLLGLKTLVPVERNGINYLVPFIKQYGEYSLTRNIKDHAESKLKWTSWANDECDRIIKDFIIPTPNDHIVDATNSGVQIPIYKYKENV